jgi:PEP-CTERM motif
MKLLRIAGAIVGLLVAPLASVADAAPLLFHFNVGFTSGPLAGNVDPALITIDGDDCPGNICNGVFSPGDATHTLLDLSVTVQGILFTASRDSGFPAFPHISFASGRLSAIDYDGVVNGNELQLFGAFPPPGNTSPGPIALFIPVSGPSSQGALSIPEPGTMSLFAAALVAALALGRRRTRTATFDSGRIL